MAGAAPPGRRFRYHRCMPLWGWMLTSLGGLLLIVAAYDVTQKKKAILRNFPIIGHFRYIFEAVGPELRQYIVTDNNEERPFSRDQRRWVYASSKQQNCFITPAASCTPRWSPSITSTSSAIASRPRPRARSSGTVKAGACPARRSAPR